MHESRRRFSRAVGVFALVALAVFALTWIGCQENAEIATEPTTETQLAGSGFVTPAEVNRTMAIQDRHTDRFLAMKGVLGTATALTPDGRIAIKVYAAEAGITGVPETLDGVPVIVEVTGEIIALAKGGKGKGGKPKEPSGKDKFDRPVPIGVSVGNINECSSGTIGCAVEAGGNRYILSNNHVLARENSASLGEDIVQPGRYDNKPPCKVKPQDKIGELYAWADIDFSGGNNVMDAAIALSSTDSLACATYTSAYGFPSSTPQEATIDMLVQKVGRTTGWTTGTVTAINATVTVSYGSRSARFIDQIEVSGSGVAKSGDSGSLFVTNDNNKDPVGLLFAGNRRGTFVWANQIAPVLERFGVTICGQ